MDLSSISRTISAARRVPTGRTSTRSFGGIKRPAARVDPSATRTLRSSEMAGKSAVPDITAADLRTIRSVPSPAYAPEGEAPTLAHMAAQLTKGGPGAFARLSGELAQAGRSGWIRSGLAGAAAVGGVQQLPVNAPAPEDTSGLSLSDQVANGRKLVLMPEQLTPTGQVEAQGPRGYSDGDVWAGGTGSQRKVASTALLFAVLAINRGQ